MPKRNKSADKSSATNAIELLKSDHREVEALFEDFQSADEDGQEDIADQICLKLTVHAQIEEEILYPAAKAALDDEDADLVNEAEVEHASAKDLIAKIEEMTSEDETFKATVKVLSEYIKHHVKEEETELFPKLEAAGLDLDDIGAQLMERKLELMEELSDDAKDEDSSDDDSEEEDEEASDDEVEAKPPVPPRNSGRARKSL